LRELSIPVSVLKKIWMLLRLPERRSAVVLLMMMVIGASLETLGIGLVVPAIALLTQPGYAASVPVLRPVFEALGNPDQPTLMIYAMTGLTVAYLFKNGFLAIMTSRQVRFAFAMQAQLSRRLFTTYLHKPYTFHLLRNSAELLRNVTTEVALFSTHAMIPGMLLLTEGLVLIGLFTLLCVVEPVGALTVISVLGLAAWTFHYFTRSRLSRWGIARQHHEGLRIQHLQEGLGGVKDIKLLGREIDFVQQYDVHNAASARMSQLQSTLYHLPRLWLELLAVLGLAALVVVIIVQGRPVETLLPTLALFAAAAFRLMPSANRAIAGLQSLRYGLPVIDMLYTELADDPATRVGASERKSLPFSSELKLVNVTFRYPDARGDALKDLSVVIRRGETVGFIGASGAGKSTFADVLLGLLRPDAGCIRVDGADIHSDIRGWQDRIGYVPQSIYLTDDTLRRNIAFGLPAENIDDDAVWRVLRAAQLEEFVMSLPAGLDSVVGERGVRLSGGQRQRIGIARALYHDPDVVVLDEATSSLDTATERGVMLAVRALHGIKTIVIIAHRLTTVEHCDRLYRLDRGRVVEEGTPASLLQHRLSG
jgi:ATP-binding cassette, subfamily B, bacterial PglK